MKKIISAIISLIMIVQMFTVLPVMADETKEPYVAPDSPAVTYNMNLDWKFYDAKTDKSISEVMESVIKDGKQFYDKDYDDSNWETVSIPHGIGGGTNSFTGANFDAGGGYRSMLLYRKTIKVPNYVSGSKVFFELEGIRQAAYLWVNGQKVGYYEAGITAMGFDISNYLEADGSAVIAIINDGTTGRGTTGRVISETIPGAEWGTGGGNAYFWNTKDFNEPQIGLVYDAFLHVKGSVYQTLPLYNNLKTTGNYIYADNFDIREKTATITVDAEIRNESAADGEYTLEVAVVDADGMLKYNFESEKTSVKAATDAGVVYETAVESDVYSEENLANPIGITKVNTVDVSHITASYNATDMRFWTTDDPYLYTVYTILKDADGKVVDIQKKETGFRKVTYDPDKGILINDKAVWMTGYAQRSTNEWAVIGSATDWLQDFDMELLKENNSNFIRWMHVAPKPAQVRSSDRYGVAVVCPAGDKEKAVDGRDWSHRVEAMRDAMIYFRNNPSVIFWETGNSAVGSGAKADEMAELRDTIDPKGMRFIGARSTTAADQLNYDYNYAGTMYGNYASSAKSAMQSNGKMGPIMETEYARGESPRRVWDRYSPPDYDYVNKLVYKEGKTGNKKDGYDVWNATQEEMAISNVQEYNGYWSNRAGKGNSIYSAEAMMIWSDSNMHTRNTATENCRTSGRVDPVRQTKEMFEATRVAHSSESAVHVIGHWSYPQLTDDTYNYFGRENVVFEVTKEGIEWSYDKLDPTQKLKRNPLKKTVYVIASDDVEIVELYRLDGDKETLLGTDETADSSFIYQFDNIDVTQGDAVIAKAYNARGEEVALNKKERTYDAVTLRLTPHTAIKENEKGETVPDWRADGSDIAYFDVEVIDNNGNVCVLNYDKINFTYEGEGVYLGGYNSGSGAGCLNNTSESEGFSFYFGGDKSGVSTIGKDYVYAENGTNRIFVKSTRNAGTFTLSASMDGMLPVSASITSNAVETDGGLTLQMQSRLTPGVVAPPAASNVPPMKPLMSLVKIFDWANVKIETKEEEKLEYYDVYINGTKLDKGYPTYVNTTGGAETLFGPIYEILKAAQEVGATGFSMVYDDSKSPVTLTVTKDGHTYEYQENSNQYITDGTEYNECVDMAIMKDGVFIANLPLMLELAGVKFSYDDDNNILNITVQ